MADPDGSLPYARQEASRISAYAAKHVGASPYFGSDATKMSFQCHSPKAAVIHIASHAVFEEQAPDFSAILMAGGDMNPELNLEAHDIGGLRLAHPLVVLSGCNTGRGMIENGSELLGFARSFFAAGAGSVIGTRWPVRDRATSEFMTEFYRGLVDDELAPAAALQSARRSHVMAGGFRHPGYWAAFAHFGVPASWSAEDVEAWRK